MAHLGQDLRHLRRDGDLGPRRVIARLGRPDGHDLRDRRGGCPDRDYLRMDGDGHGDGLRPRGRRRDRLALTLLLVQLLLLALLQQLLLLLELLLLLC